MRIPGRGVLILTVLLFSLGVGWHLKRTIVAGENSTPAGAPVTLEPRPRPHVTGLLKTNTEPIDPPPSMPDSADRVAAARLRHGNMIAARYAGAGIKYPPKEVFLRAFKYEAELELWSRDSKTENQPFRLVNSYPILRASGRLGPKRREGDLQVPEGFYSIDRFNPRSLFHLSLGLNYPNASDRVLTTNKAAPGSDVFIHGGSESIGCLALGDPTIEEVFLAAWDAKQAGQNAIQVQIFPCRLNADQWSELLTPVANGNERLVAFWRSLQKAYDTFEQTHLPIPIEIAADGSYIYPRTMAE